MSTEQQILDLIRKVIPHSEKYLHDDAALIEKELLITTDTLVENTHFKPGTHTPEEIGYKALVVNLSDIAAMGGKPLYALVALSLPKHIKLSWISKLYKGINSCAKKYKTQIIGGNLAKSKEINITITVIGKVNRRPALRSSAKTGDLVFTSGTFGNSACGYLLLKTPSKFFVSWTKELTKSHKMPVPQIKLGQKIIQLTNRAALMDSSDGLADCLIQIANESKVKIIVEEDKIPISINSVKCAKFLKENLLNLALYGGEEYQLVGTASKNDCKKLQKTSRIKIIGKAVKGRGAFLKQKNGRLVKLDMKHAFKHFT